MLHHILRDNQLQSLQQPHGKKYQQYRNAQAQNAAAHQIQCSPGNLSASRSTRSRSLHTSIRIRKAAKYTRA